MEEYDLVWWIMIPVMSRGWPGVCASLTWGTHGTRMHYGKKVSWQRQRDALGNVLLGQLGSSHPCACYSDTNHLPLHCYRPLTPFHRNSIPWWLRVGFSRLMCRATKKNGSEKVWGAQQRVWAVDLASKILQISIQSSIFGMCWKSTSKPWRPLWTTYRT